MLFEFCTTLQISQDPTNERTTLNTTRGLAYSELAIARYKPLKMKFAFAATVFCASAFVGVDALPNGAAGCKGGGPAVEGPGHLRDGATNGTLADGGVTITIGDTVMAPGDTFMALPMDVHDLVATAANAPIRGILVRLECKTDLTGALTSEDPLLVDATACAQDDNFVVGVTHNSADDKPETIMQITLEAVTTVSVDVTVVMQNDQEASVYYYDQFRFRAEYPACDICGDLGPIGNFSGIVQIPPGTLPGVDITEITCAEANEIALGGGIPSQLCPLTPTLAGVPCQCGQVAPNVTMIPATMAPATMGPETMGPETMIPATMVPVTMAPATMGPDTMGPDTMMPATMGPDTMAPTTMAPVIAPTPIPTTPSFPPPTPTTEMPSSANGATWVMGTLAMMVVTTWFM